MTSSEMGHSFWRAVSVAPLKLVLNLLAVSLITFFATNAIPGDTSREILGREATEAQITEFRQAQGLDRPVVERYAVWVRNVATGKWGRSLASQTAVWETIRPRLVRTLILVTAAFLLAVPISVAIGLISGSRTGGLLDSGVSAVTLIITGVPEFVVGIALLALLGVQLGWLPVDSTNVALTSTSTPDAIRAYALPVIVLALIVAPYLIRMTRSNTREVIGEPFILSAILRGIRPPSLLFRHVLPNAMPPVVNGTAVTMASMVAGVVAIENVVAFPGIGQLLVSSVLIKDVPVVQIIALIVSATFVAMNMLADLIVLSLTPRLRTA